MPIDPGNYESRNIGHKESKEIRHDDHITVNYNSAAAEVLELLSTLNYRLNFRSQAIDLLRSYYTINHSIPPFESVDREIADLTRDQINTLFNSYLGFIQAVFELSIFDSQLSHFVKSCLDYKIKFEKDFGIKPSYKAVSQASIYEHLPLYTEKEVEIILTHFEKVESEKFEGLIVPPQTDNQINLKAINKNEVLSESYEIIDDQVTEENKERLLQKYAYLKTPQDLKALPNEVRLRIKELFRSELAFLKMVKSQ